MSRRVRLVGLLTKETFRELAFHNRWFHVCIWSLLVLLLASRILTELPLGSAAPKLLFDAGQGAILATGSIVLILALAYYLFQELDTGTAQAYLVHGLTRFEYLLGKLLGCWLSVVFALGLADGLLAMLTVLEVNQTKMLVQELTSPSLGTWLQLFLCQSIHLLVLGSVTLCMVSLSRTFLFAVLTSLLIWVIALMLGGAAETVSASGLSEWGIRILGLLVPRFEIWEISSRLWHEGPMPPSNLLIRFLFAGLYSVVFFAVALALFNRREL